MGVYRDVLQREFRGNRFLHGVYSLLHDDASYNNNLCRLYMHGIVKIYDVRLSSV